MDIKSIKNNKENEHVHNGIDTIGMLPRKKRLFICIGSGDIVQGAYNLI